MSGQSVNSDGGRHTLTLILALFELHGGQFPPQISRRAVADLGRTSVSNISTRTTLVFDGGVEIYLNGTFLF